MKNTIRVLAVMSAAFAVAGVVLALPSQSAFAQSAASTGAATDFGSAGSAATGNFFTGESSSSSAAGRDVDCFGGGGLSDCHARFF
jgi:hypothetical protein